MQLTGEDKLRQSTEDESSPQFGGESELVGLGQTDEPPLSANGIRGVEGGYRGHREGSAGGVGGCEP